LVVLVAAVLLSPRQAAGAWTAESEASALVRAAVPAAADQSIVLQPFVSGLAMPVFVTHPGDGSGRLFVVEQAGQIRMVKDGQLARTPFLDISALVTSTYTEQGLLGLAFHPQYERNGRFFVYYTAKPTDASTVGNNTLAEYRVSLVNPDVADPTVVRTLLSIPDGYANHNGGMIAFGPDGYLYVGIGDAGIGNEPEESAQDPGSLFGKLLRLDVDVPGTPAPPGSGYGIPPGNPFVGRAGARPEVWAIGFRNPWRWSFDRQTGDIFLGDVGQLAWEEIDLLPTGLGGLNFGWDDREGAHCYEPMSGCLTAGLTEPILEYSHSEGCAAVTGGYVYRGTTFPSLSGAYFYGDYCEGHIWKARSSSGRSGPWITTHVLDPGFSISSFGEDEAGELYVVSHSTGAVLRLAPAVPEPTATPSPTATATVTPTPTACQPRPNVVIRAVPNGDGRLRVTLTAASNPGFRNTLHAVAWGTFVNATVDIIGAGPVQQGQRTTFPVDTLSVTFLVARASAGQATTVSLTATDSCGDFPTFVGGGPSAF